MDYLTISPTPTDEPCVQVGSDLYSKWSLKESMAFKNQCIRVLERQFTEVHTVIRIMSFPHDFGSYREVVAMYETPEQIIQALWLESNTPENWDVEAIDELGPDYFEDMTDE